MSEAQEEDPLIPRRTTTRREFPVLEDDAPVPLTNFDQILDHVGTFGHWQMWMIFLLWLPPLGGGVIVLLWSFAGLEPQAFRSVIINQLIGIYIRIHI